MTFLIFLEILGIGEKGPFTDDALVRVETLIDRLKPKVGHANIVGVWIDETYRNSSTPCFSDRPPLFFKGGFGLLNQLPGNHLRQQKVESGLS